MPAMDDLRTNCVYQKSCTQTRVCVQLLIHKAVVLFFLFYNKGHALTTADTQGCQTIA